MSTNHENIRPSPHEDFNNLALLSSWNVWSMRRKRSRQSLLDDLNGIDPVIQKHMTISVTANPASEANKEVMLLQHQYQQYKLDNTRRFITKKEFQVDINRITKHRRSTFQDQIFGVSKLRRLKYHKSKKLPSYHMNGGNQDYDTHYTFWRNLNALTGSIHAKKFDPTH